MQNIEEIYDKYFETVNKYLFCLTRDADTAENLTQETFYRAVKNINKFKGKCIISTWLCKIAKNAFYDECRKNKKIKYTTDEELTQMQSNQFIENEVFDGEEKLELYKRMQKLDEKTREVIYLRITGELSFKEIGNILNKTENWARVTFYRGKEKLKEVD